MTLVVIAFVLMLLALGAALASRGGQLRRLLTDGVATTGEVVGRVDFGRRGRYLRYAYHDASGRRHEHRALVSESVWEAHPEGTAIPVVYAASRPSVSAPRWLVEQARAALARRAAGG